MCRRCPELAQRFNRDRTRPKNDADNIHQELIDHILPRFEQADKAVRRSPGTLSEMEAAITERVPNVVRNWACDLCDSLTDTLETFENQAMSNPDQFDTDT